MGPTIVAQDGSKSRAPSFSSFLQLLSEGRPPNETEPPPFFASFLPRVPVHLPTPLPRSRSPETFRSNLPHRQLGRDGLARTKSRVARVGQEEPTPARRAQQVKEIVTITHDAGGGTEVETAVEWPEDRVEPEPEAAAAAVAVEES